MALKTRLDGVVKLREREEERAARLLAEAAARLQRARDELAAAKDRLERGEFGSGSAADWELRDVGKVRDRLNVEKAVELAGAAHQHHSSAHTAHVKAHQKTEVVRRVADTRRDALRAEAERKEQRITDEFMMMRRPSDV